MKQRQEFTNEISLHSKVCTARKQEPAEREKSWPAIHQTKDQYPEYRKSSKNQTLKGEIIQSVNGQMN
jgi:hypothetical protein